MNSITVDAHDLSLLPRMETDYEHEERTVRPGDLLPIRNGLLKWYDVYRDDYPIAMAETASARAFVQAEAATGILAADYGLGHVVHHQSGGGTFLLVGVWRGHNELWERVYIRPTADPEAPWQPESGNLFHPVACVWEMTPIWHERNAWSRFLFSSRDDAALRTFLADQMTGSTR
jgi:hypothetical protein